MNLITRRKSKAMMSNKCKSVKTSFFAAFVGLFVSLVLQVAAPSAPIASADTADCPTFVMVDGMGNPGIFGRNAERGIVIRYPASVAPAGGIASHDESVERGHAELLRVILEINGRCDGVITVVGYSLGAEIAGNVLNQIAVERSVPSWKIRGVLFADPRQPGGVASILPPLPGINLGGVRPGFGDIFVETICVPGDGICEAQMLGLIAGVHGYFAIHPNYQALIDQVLNRF